MLLGDYLEKDLKNGVILEPGSPLFGASLGVEETQAIVDEELGKV